MQAGAMTQARRRDHTGTQAGSHRQAGSAQLSKSISLAVKLQLLCRGCLPTAGCHD